MFSKPLPLSPQGSTHARRRSVPIEAVAALLEGVEAIGGDTGEALARAGLSSFVELIAAGAQAEVPRRAFARLAQDCVLAFHYHACRRDSLTPNPVSNFRLICIAMLACPDLRTAVTVAAQFQSLVVDRQSRLRLSEAQGMATLLLQTGVKGRQIGDMLVMMFGLASFHRMFGWLIHEEIRLDRVMLDFPAANEREAFNTFLQMEPAFDEPTSGIRFPSRYLDRPVVRTYSELSDLFAMFPFDLLPPDYEDQTLAERVVGVVRSSLTQNEVLPGLPQLASIFGLSEMTFRRRLAEQGTGVAQIHRACRRDLAQRLLRESSQTVKEIAYCVQFNDVSTFRRAFRTWTGQSPHEYRAETRTAGSHPPR